MERRRRTSCIVVLAAMSLLGGCALAVAVGIVGWLTGWSFDWDRAPGSERHRVEQSFAVSNTPKLEIDAFAGNVVIRPGQDGVIHVVATKKAALRSDLSRIKVRFSQEDGGLRIHLVQSNPPFGVKDASVDLEIVTPPDTRLEMDANFGNLDVQGLRGQVNVDTTAGNVNIRDLVGPIKVSTDFGMIDIRDVAGLARLTSNAGTILYQGEPQGECRFESNFGAVVLGLPRDSNLELHLRTDLGSVDVDCPLSGRVTRREVRGVMGSGGQGTVHAVNGVGGIGLSCK